MRQLLFFTFLFLALTSNYSDLAQTNKVRSEIDLENGASRGSILLNTIYT